MPRTLWCVVAVPTTVEWQYVAGELLMLPSIPTVVGPFKTKHQAARSGERDWANHPAMRYTILPMMGYSNERDEQISLTYDMMHDPTRRLRKPTQAEINAAAYEEHLEQAARVRTRRKRVKT